MLLTTDLFFQSAHRKKCVLLPSSKAKLRLCMSSQKSGKDTFFSSSVIMPASTK